MVDGSGYIKLRGTEVRGGHSVPAAGRGWGRDGRTCAPGWRGALRALCLDCASVPDLAVTLAAVCQRPPLGEAACRRTGAPCSVLQLPVNLQ